MTTMNQKRIILIKNILYYSIKIRRRTARTIATTKRLLLLAAKVNAITVAIAIAVRMIVGYQKQTYRPLLPFIRHPHFHYRQAKVIILTMHR